MTTEDLPSPCNIAVQFHSSSAKDGKEAYSVSVDSGCEVVTAEEAFRIFGIVRDLRRACLKELAPKDDTLDKLAQSMAKASANARAEVEE